MPRAPMRHHLTFVVALVIALVASFARADEPAGLDLLFGTTGAPLPARTGNLEKDAEAVRVWMRDRLTQHAFYKSVLPRLFAVFSKPPYGPYFKGLRSASINGRTVYFTPQRDPKKPCDVKDQAEVQPWWDASAKVFICTDDYKPEVRTDHNFADSTSHCEIVYRPGNECGCGPHLVYCAPAELASEIMAAVREEPQLTAEEIIRHHLPFSTLLTSKDTVHAGVLDAVYQRYVQGDDLKPFRWTAAERTKVAWRPRPPQFTGGMLSTPHALNWDFARRVTGRIAWDDFLCMPLVAAQTHTEDIFLLPSGNLRFRGQDRLTQMTGCKECHRRLEGIVHAYSDFALPVIGYRYIPVNEQGAQTSFYGRDSRDLRAEGPTTPGFIGETLVKQPEYPACMAHRVEQLFFGGEPVPLASHELLRERFAAHDDFASLLEDTAVLRLLGPDALTFPQKSAVR